MPHPLMIVNILEQRVIRIVSLLRLCHAPDMGLSVLSTFNLYHNFMRQVLSPFPFYGGVSDAKRG